MPDEREQRALDQIKAYLDAGHSLDAVREAGWAGWIDHLEAQGYDLRTGRLKIAPPADIPPPPPPPPPAAEPRATTPLEAAAPAPVTTVTASSTPVCERCGTERVGTRPYCVKCAWKWPDGTPAGPTPRTNPLYRSKWAWAVVGLIAVFIGLIVVGTIVGGDSTGESDSAVQASVQTEVTATEQSSQFPTQLPQSRATATPQAIQAAAAESSSLTEDCLTFTTAVADASNQGTESMTRISDLSFEAADNPFLVLTTTWQSDLQGEYDKLQQARDQVASATPPTGDFGAVKSKVLEGFDLVLASEAPFLEGVNNLDADLLQQAADLINQGATAFSSASDMIDGIDPLDCIG